jgi:hypothetical protein
MHPERVTDTCYVRHIPDREFICDYAGKLFQVHQEEVWRRQKDIPDEPAASSLPEIGHA